jgi:hypothetical protein
MIADWMFLLGLAISMALIGLGLSEWTGRPVAGALIGYFGMMIGVLFGSDLPTVLALSLFIVATGVTVLAVMLIHRYQDRQCKRSLALWRGQQAGNTKETKEKK